MDQQYGRRSGRGLRGAREELMMMMMPWSVVIGYTLVQVGVGWRLELVILIHK